MLVRHWAIKLLIVSLGLVAVNLSGYAQNETRETVQLLPVRVGESGATSTNPGRHLATVEIGDFG